MSVTNNTRRLRGFIVLALIGVLLAPAGVAAAQEAETVSFVGSGWGHGVGLSQYGAYGASRDGWTAEQILEYFYQGTSIGVIGEGGLAPRENLWVNLEKDRSHLVLIAHETGLVSPAEPVIVSRGTDKGDHGSSARTTGW